MSLKDEFLQQPFGAYCYSYPHKTAYRRLVPLSLRQVWQEEKRDALFLYIHVPFCASSCGYCNLLSMPGGGPDLLHRFLEALRRQAEAVRQHLGRFAIARMAVGGGTPSLLTPEQLEALFTMTREVLGVDLPRVQTSLELSPATTTPERLAVARYNYTHRVSIGVQSFSPRSCWP